MTENDIKAELVREARQHPTFKRAVVQAHVEIVTGGTPDVSITVRVRTIWLELKLLTPKNRKPRSRDLQDVRMLELEACGLARYVIYDYTHDVLVVWIVRPVHYYRHKKSGEWRTTATRLTRGTHVDVLNHVEALLP